MIRLIYFLVIFYGCTSERQEVVAIVQSEELLELQSQGIKVVDIRTLDEFNAGHIPDVIHIDFFAENFLEKMSALNVDQVVIHCASGGRSGKASKILQKAGFKKVYDYSGGFNEWKTKGLKIDK
ncbi:rhodanese-like domain-containing protein [Ekhidna sp.]